MRRAQLFSQPFMLVFALLVGASVLIWGAYQVVQLSQYATHVQLVDATNSFRNEVQKYFYLDEGSTKLYPVRFPGDITYLCVSDKTTPVFTPNIPPAELTKNFIQARPENVFVLPHDAYPTTFFQVDHAKPASHNPLCVRNGQQLKLVSKGDYVEISLA